MNRTNGRSVPWTILRRRDQACLAVLLTLLLGTMIASWLYHGGHRGQLIDIDRAEPQRLRFQVDINRASWPEWSLLPRIGETLARRIVESRQREGPFRDHEDLLRVKGIGPRTLENIRPYLLPVRRDASRPGD